MLACIYYEKSFILIDSITKKPEILFPILSELLEMKILLEGLSKCARSLDCALSPFIGAKGPFIPSLSIPSSFYRSKLTMSATLLAALKTTKPINT